MRKIFKYYIFSCLLSIVSYTVLAQVPIIKKIDPVLGYSGQQINIKGSGFAAGAQVFFGGVEGTVITTSSQLIEAIAPAGTTFNNIVVLNPSTDQSGYSSERFFISYGGDNGLTAGDFSTQLDITAEDGLYDVCICDLDGDGLNDVAASNSKDNKASLLRNLSSPTSLSLSKTPVTISATTLNVTCGDLTGDGRPEIIFTEASDGERIFVLINASSPGSFSFSMQTKTITGASTKRVAINDLDRDGKPDLVVTDQSTNKVYILPNTTTAGVLSFGSQIELTVTNASSTAGLEVQDLNNDGKPEIIVSQFNTSGGGVFIAQNNSTSGNFDFSSFSQFNTAGFIANIKVADLNEDDKPDIVASLLFSQGIAPFINETTNTGTPSFTVGSALAVDDSPWGLDYGDMDGDGKKDLLVAHIGSDLAINILNNNTSGNTLNFQQVSIPVSFINRNIKAADMDGDSKPDIVFTSVDDVNQGINADKISILRNNKCLVPKILPTESLTLCTGNTTRLEAQLIDGAIYTWNDGSTDVKSGTDNFLNVTATGDYTVTMETEGGACTETSEIVSIEVKAAGALPSPAITSPSGPICIGSTLTLTSQNVGATSYEWRGPEGFSETGLSVSLNDFTFNNTGRYYLDVYSGDCIIETKSIIVEAIVAPTFSISQSGTGSYCQGDPVTLTVAPNDPGFSYQWFDESGAISGATGITFSPIVSNSYYVEATDLINLSCPTIESSTTEVTFLQTPQAQFSTPPSGCANTQINFTNESVVDSEATATYLWDFDDGATSSLENPTHAYNDTGIYDVVLTVSYQGLSCSDQTSHQVTIEGSINVEIISSSSTFCSGEMVELSLTDSFTSYVWSTGETTPSITVAEGDTYSVTVNDASGCVGSDDITINQLTAPTVEISASDSGIAPGETITLTASGLTSYSWSPGSLVTDSTASETETTLFETTSFTVSGPATNGCRGSAELEVIVLQDKIGSVLGPEKFISPNGDNINQYWEVEKLDQFPQCGVEIYDQTGNKLYESKPYLNDWDGTSKGNQLPSGVYYYVIKCEGEKIVKSGSITLLR